MGIPVGAPELGEGGLVAGTCVCEGASLCAALREDVDRYVAAAERDGGHALPARIGMLLSLKFWAVACYRLAHVALTRVRPRAWARLLAIGPLVGQRVLTALTGIEIDPHAHLGPGLMIPHVGDIVVGPVRVGRHCTISQGVTLGQGLLGTGPAREDTPILGDRVWVGPGAVVAGPVRLGSDVAVSPNSVVLRDVPPRGVALGVPARVISYRGSFAQVYYRGMAEDPDRAAALAAANGHPECD